MINRVFIYMLLLFVAACNTNAKTKITSLPEPKVVMPEVITDELVMNPPLDIKSFGDYLFFTQPQFDKPVLFYNMRTGHSNFWGVSGSGPDDFISASCAYLNHEDSEVEIFDTNLRKVVSFKAYIDNDSVTLTPQNRYRIETDSIFTLGLHKMDNGYYVTQVLIGHKNMFVLFNEKLEVYKTFGDAPIEEIHDENYSQLYGWFASKGNKLFFAVQGMGYLVCYDISDNGNVKKEWETKFTVPKYELNPSFRWKNDNKRGFYDIQVNNEYLFLSFSGKSYEEEDVLPEGVLILDHKGELVDYIKLDNNHTMAKFTVSGDSIFTYNKLDQLLMFNWRQTISRK